MLRNLLRLALKFSGWGFFLLFVLCSAVLSPAQSISAPDTVRIAVWPFQYTGLTASAQDLQWGSGMRVLLSAMLDAHPAIRTSDRVEMEEVLKLAQISRFGPESQSIPTHFEGADYIIMGQYFMRDRKNLAHLEIRMFAVENGAILADHHLNLPRLPVTRIPMFLQAFAEDVVQRLKRTTPLTLGTACRPCKSNGLRYFIEASAAREAAFAATDAQAALRLYDQANQSYQLALPAFCEPEWLHQEVEEAKRAGDAIRQLLPNTDGSTP